jgi:hypothetical protein
MPEITLKGAQPFDLFAQEQAVSTGLDGIVAMTVPVCAEGSPENVFQIRLLVTPEMADYMVAQLRPAAMAARTRSPRQPKSPIGSS